VNNIIKDENENLSYSDKELNKYEIEIKVYKHLKEEEPVFNDNKNIKR
jgi:hypothetical protein